MQLIRDSYFFTDSIYLPGRTDVQLSAWDRKAVPDQGSNEYLIEVDKSDGCASDNLSVTLIWMEPGMHFRCFVLLSNKTVSF